MLNPIEAKYLVDAIRASKYKPKGHEISFLKSMEENIKNGRYASVKQSKWLQEIYRKSQSGNGYQHKERS